MSALLTAAEVATRLVITPTSDELADLAVLVDQVEATFLRAAGRADIGFQAAETGRVELHNGTGSNLLFLDYPISDVTSITLGANLSDLDETLDPDDTDQVVWVAGKKYLSRTDGIKFGEEWQARYVRVVYDAAADLPADAKGAILNAIVQIWQRKGSEGLLSERIGPYSTDYAELLAGNDSITSGDPVWRMAVDAHMERHL